MGSSKATSVLVACPVQWGKHLRYRIWKPPPKTAESGAVWSLGGYTEIWGALAWKRGDSCWASSRGIRMWLGQEKQGQGHSSRVCVDGSLFPSGL